MQQILDAIASAFGTFFANDTVQLILRGIGFYIVFLWLATAYWAYRDMSARTMNPVAPYLAAGLIIVFTPVLFVFSWLLYRILRPHETVAEANERALAEEAMLVEVEKQAHCANCGRAVQPEWLICPTCRNRLRRLCSNCGRLVELDWSLCAYCGKDFERPVPLPAHTRPAVAGGAPAIVPAGGGAAAARALAAASASGPVAVPERTEEIAAAAPPPAAAPTPLNPPPLKPVPADGPPARRTGTRRR
jgi:RNA polymerase subunit RPABC4/transcription elongation factor Spt4